MEHEENNEEHQTAFIPTFLTVYLRDTVMADWIWEKRNVISISYQVAAMRKVKRACQRYNASYLLLTCGGKESEILRHEAKLDIRSQTTLLTFSLDPIVPPAKSPCSTSCDMTLALFGFRTTKSFRSFILQANWSIMTCGTWTRWWLQGYHLARRGYLMQSFNKVWAWQVKFERRARW